MEYVVIIAGRYHPYHLGHKASYDYAAREFGANNVYIATSDKQAPITSPFTFSDKVKMMTSLGIPSDHIVQSKSPYQAKEITDSVADPEHTVVIYGVSEKDMQGEGSRFKFGIKKDGSPTYLQPLPADINECEPMTEHAYVMVVPTVTFKVLGQDANSATQLRKLYIDSDDNTRENIIADLYGHFDPELKSMFDSRLVVTEKAQDIAEISRDKDTVKNLSENQRLRLYKTMQTILLTEKAANKITQAKRPPTPSGYTSEK